MIQLFVTAADKDTANQYVRDNIDHGAGDTFTVNKQDVSGNQYCVIALPDNGSDYTTKMVAQFGLQDIADAEEILPTPVEIAPAPVVEVAPMEAAIPVATPAPELQESTSAPEGG